MLFDISDITTPILMTSHRSEWHFQLGARLTLRLFKAVELPVCGHDAPTGRGTDLDAHAQERSVDAILTQQGILLKFADLISHRKCGFANPLVGFWLCI